MTRLTGIVTIRQGYTHRPFAKDDDGAYHGAARRFRHAHRGGRRFQLREKTGEVIAFRSDGMLDFLQDTNGNRITAGVHGQPVDAA